VENCYILHVVIVCTENINYTDYTNIATFFAPVEFRNKALNLGSFYYTLLFKIVNFAFPHYFCLCGSIAYMQNIIVSFILMAI